MKTHYRSYLIARLTALTTFLGATSYAMSKTQSDSTLSPTYWSDFSLPANHLPIAYDPIYNITFWGIEKLHPFDSQKYGRVFNFLTEAGVMQPGHHITPLPAGNELLSIYHTTEYLGSLREATTLAKITEMAPVRFFPSSVTDRKVLLPMRTAVGGSLLAARAAFERGWGINLGGGFHHAHARGGGGFCVYADITMIAGELRRHTSKRKVMVIDLDAHQGNGQARDLGGDADTHLLDIYNAGVYPQDHEAIAKITNKVELQSGTGDADYLTQLRAALQKSFEEFAPEFIVYNAGTDTLTGDALGRMELSESAIVERDEIVFRHAREKSVPIVMLLSGGYQKTNAGVIAKSVKNLAAKGLLR